MIDLETTMRAITLTQSDGPVIRYSNIINQAQNHGLNLTSAASMISVLKKADGLLYKRTYQCWKRAYCGTTVNLYLTMHAPVCRGLEPSYEFRSSMTGGGGNSYDLNNLSEEAVRYTAAVYQQVRPYFEGNYYPLFDSTVDESQWFGYQLHRPDEERGMIVVFRREACPENMVFVQLNAIDSQARYELIEKDSGQISSTSGEKMRILPITIKESPGSQILFYKVIP